MYIYIYRKTDKVVYCFFSFYLSCCGFAFARMHASVQARLGKPYALDSLPAINMYRSPRGRCGNLPSHSGVGGWDFLC